MSVTLPIETADHELKRLLEQLPLGETLTLVDSEGVPVALVISLQRGSIERQPMSDWQARWAALAEKVSRAWR